MIVLVEAEEEEEMVDVHWKLRMVMDAVYLKMLLNDMGVNQRRKVKRRKDPCLHYHDDVLLRMVQRISVYNLEDSSS